MQFFSLGFLTFKNLQFSITIKAWVVQKERAEFYFNIFSSLLVRKFALKQWPRASVILWVNKRQIEKRYNTPQKIHKLPIRRKKTFLFLVKRKRGIYSLSYWTIFNYYHSYEQTTFLSVLFWFGLVFYKSNYNILCLAQFTKISVVITWKKYSSLLWWNSLPNECKDSESVGCFFELRSLIGNLISPISLV